MTKRAAIHDLGYQRYVGTRRPQRTRWQVIVRNLVSMSWKGWWRYKLAGTMALMITIGVGVAMYFSRNELFKAANIGSQIQTIADGLIPQSYAFYEFSALLIGLTILSSAISRDLHAGAFEFYFCRPVRPIDYIFGKVAGACLLMAPVMLIGPLILTIYRLALTADAERIADALPWIPRAIAVGLLATVVHATVALAFGALSYRPRYATAGYAAFMLLFGSIFSAIAQGTNRPELAALDLGSAINGVASALFEVNFLFEVQSPSLGVSLLALTSYILVSLAIIGFRVSQARRLGMGGG